MIPQQLPTPTTFGFATRFDGLMAKIVSRMVADPGLDYRKETHINRALRKHGGKTYVEIGVRMGECFSQIHAARKIAVDPEPDGFGGNLGPGELFFRKTSDDFFAQDAPQVLAAGAVDVAFVDGLHEFRQALRDVLNLEKYMSPGGVIFIHDCNPPTRKHANVRDGGPWSGDVWKVPYYLRTCRRDLSLVTLDCDWGVGVVKGFSEQKIEPDDKVLDDIAKLDYDVLERSRTSILNLKHPVLTRFNCYI